MARVMIVDDADVVGMVLTRALTAAGHAVVATATTGAQALSCYQTQHPDVVLLDISLPDMDGFAVLRHLKESDPQVKAIICTARQLPEMRRAMAEMGALAYLVKPVNHTELLGLLQAL